MLLTLGSAVGHRAGPGDPLRPDLGLRGVLRGDLQRPDAWASGRSGIRVMTTQGVPITGSQAAIRNLIGAVDGPLPVPLPAGPGEHAADLAVPEAGRPGGRDDGGGRGVAARARRCRGSRRRRSRSSCRSCRSGSRPARRWPGRSRITSGTGARFGRDRREEIARHLARPLRERYGLPDAASSDAVLCAFYHRLFLGE